VIAPHSSLTSGESSLRFSDFKSEISVDYVRVLSCSVWNTSLLKSSSNSSGCTPPIEACVNATELVRANGIGPSANQTFQANTFYLEFISSRYAVNQGFTAVWSPASNNAAKICGNGIRETLWEECDDGNTADGDGCSKECMIELGWRCSADNSQCICACCGRISSPRGNVSVPASTSGYVDNLLCEWTIGAGDDGISLRFVNFFTESSYDQVTISSCANATCFNATVVTLLSGDISASGIINITSGIARVKFIADNCISGKGFSVFWVPLPEVGSSSCGNGLREALEMCDDGNRESGDGCAADCSEVDLGYRCSTDGSAPCTPTCGDGVKAKIEDCDDGNSIDGDGCSKNCTCESVPCLYTVSERGHLASVLATASDGTTIRLLNTTYGDVVSQTLQIASSDITITFTGPASQKRPVLGGAYGSAMKIGPQAQRIRLKNVDLSPGFRFYLQSGSSLEISETAADHVGFFAENASVKINSATFTQV
jgi:cysteine-rich repeat protein